MLKLKDLQRSFRKRTSHQKSFLNHLSLSWMTCFFSTKKKPLNISWKLIKFIKHLSQQAGLFHKCNDFDNRNRSVRWMAFLQGKRYMFNMVVLIYIFLHSSKYSINTVNKPSHNVSFIFQHLAFLWPFHTSSVSALGILNGQKTEKQRKKQKVQNLTSTLLTSRDNTKKYNTSNM